MNIERLEFFVHQLKFRRLFKTSVANLTVKDTVIIKLFDENKRSTLGEASPMSLFGTETIQDVTAALAEMQSLLPIELTPEDFMKENFSVAGITVPPTLRAAFEQAVLSYSMRFEKRTLDDITGRRHNYAIPVNGLFSLDAPEDSIVALEKMIEKNFSSIKIKVGIIPLEEEIKFFEAARVHMIPSTIFRLDANGSWSLEEAAKRCKAYEQFAIEYIEQPISNIKDFAELKKHTSLHIAADESLRSHESIIDAIDNKLADVLVLKPNFVGGLFPTLRYIDRAISKNIKTVVTTTLESAIGRKISVAAAAYNTMGNAAGLSVVNLYENDFFEENIYFPHNGLIDSLVLEV